MHSGKAGRYWFRVMAGSVVCLALVWAWTLAVSAADAVITVMPRVTVKEEKVRLGDIAVVATENAIFRQWLKELVVAQAPQPGQTLPLTGELLRIRLAQAGVDVRRVDLRCPENLSVTRDFQVIAGSRLVETGRKLIMTQVPYAPADVQIAPVSEPRDVIAPAGKLEVQARLPAGLRFTAPTVVALDVTVDQALFRTVYLQYKVQAFTSVLIAARPIAAYERLDIGNTRLERRNVARLPLKFVTSLAEIAGTRAKRNITPGTPITRDMLEIPPVIKRGAPVTIRVVAGNMVIYAPGIAQQDGRPGETIRVQNTDTQKIIFAQVVDAGTVQPLTNLSQ